MSMRSDAEALVALKEVFYAATQESGDAARANTLRGSHVQAVLDAGAAVDAACESFRRRHFPRAHRVICAQGEVLTVSKTGRSVRGVYPL